jgi:hypothetical protein
LEEKESEAAMNNRVMEEHSTFFDTDMKIREGVRNYGKLPPEFKTEKIRNLLLNLSNASNRLWEAWVKQMRKHLV